MQTNVEPRAARIRRRAAALWPQVPLAVVLAAVGFLNILNGLEVPLEVFGHLRALSGLVGSLSALGGTAQAILGLMLVLASIGFVWRLAAAWILSVLLLVITVGVTVAQARWNLTLVLQGLLLAAMLWARRFFTRRTKLASLLFSLSGILAVLAYGTIGAWLLRGDFQPPIGDWTAAFYYTIVTLSTVGYGDIVPVTPEARWFAVSLLVIGLGVFASAVASALGPKISGELRRVFNPEGEAMELRGHVILVGEGAVARNTARELVHRRVSFARIVASKEGLVAVGGRVVEGDATDEAVLRRAGVAKARMLIAAHEDDGENAIIALAAKDLHPGIRVLAVASSSAAIRRLKLARADVAFSPASVGGRLLADLAEGSEIPAALRGLLDGPSGS